MKSSLYKSSPNAATSLFCGLGVVGLCAMWVGIAAGDEWLTRLLGSSGLFLLMVVAAFAAAVGGCLLSLGGLVFSVRSLKREEGQTGLALLGLALSIGPALLILLLVSGVV